MQISITNQEPMRGREGDREYLRKFIALKEKKCR